MAKRHAKPTRATMQGGVIDKFMPVSVSSVAISCAATAADPHRACIDEQGRKYSVLKKCGGDL